jgi:hypothetical protein
MTWIRVTRRRGKNGKTHVGLLLPAGLLIRHALLGFQQIVSYQSFLAWLAFRPGLEALLILGKWVDDPSSAKIWREKDKYPREYNKLFSGPGLSSNSLPNSAQFRSVLGRINDSFVHSNAAFAYREVP